MIALSLRFSFLSLEGTRRILHLFADEVMTNRFFEWKMHDYCRGFEGDRACFAFKCTRVGENVKVSIDRGRGWIPLEFERARNFRGAPGGRRNRQVWKKFILSRRVSLTRSQPGTSIASTPMRQTPTRGCSPLPVCTLTWKRGRGFCTDVVRPYLSLSLPLSFSLSLLAPFLFPASLGSILSSSPPLPVCSISPSQRILKTLHLSNPHPLRIHPPYSLVDTFVNDVWIEVWIVIILSV